MCELKPNVPGSMFPLKDLQRSATDEVSAKTDINTEDTEISESQQIFCDMSSISTVVLSDEDYGHTEFLDNLEFEDLNDLLTGKADTQHPDDQEHPGPSHIETPEEHNHYEPVVMDNGKWECRHKCTDKSK
jgi:hypothetical protein